jgi:hypothetical protein
VVVSPTALRAPGPDGAGHEERRAATDRLARFREASARPVGALRAGDHPYLHLVTILLGDPPRPPAPAIDGMLGIPARRRELAARFAWAIPGEAALAVLAGLGPLLEGGAGTGYWAALLRARGADVIAVDRAPPGGPVPNPHHPGRSTWTEVLARDTVTAVRDHPDRTLLLCWPPYDDDAAGYLALRRYRGERFAYVGDGPDGATGTPRLHRELAANWTAEVTVPLPTWPGLADRLVVYRRNPVRRPLTERDRCHECGRFLVTGAIGRCARCRADRPAALTLRYGPHLVEYPADLLARMHPAQVAALRNSPHRVPG